MVSETDCELCTEPGGEVLWRDDFCRVVRVTDAAGDAFPGFCRVILNRHVAEVSALPIVDARWLLDVVVAVERTVRTVVKPDKINLASLGNVVPHLHWHVIPRWRDDSHFPAPIWAEPQRIGIQRPLPDNDVLRKLLLAELSSSHPIS